MTEKSQHQLFSILDEMTVYSHMALGRIETRTFVSVPFVTWPSGAPCVPVNQYILSMMERPGRSGNRNLSTRGSKGGTFGEYASKISHLVRYCYDANIDFIQLTDAKFTEFIETLRDEKSRIYPTEKKRTEPTILGIGRVCLAFLEFVGRLHENPSFVAVGGTIRISMHAFTVKHRNGRTTKKEFVHHHSLSFGGRIRSTFPISEKNIKRLKDAIDNHSKSRFIDSRRKIMLLLLEHTGARRGEISRILVKDILDAIEMDEPMLRLETWKQGVSSERLIPIHKMVLSDIKKHIDFMRRKVVKGKKDDGFLFVSQNSGKGISPDTITSEIALLKKAAGIKEKISPHMFRHAFITNKFVKLIKQHELQNPDQFRQSLLSSKTFIIEVMMWTGHKSSEAVERYIHLAFKKVANYAATVTSVHLASAMEVFDGKQRELLNRLKTDLSVEEYEAELLELQRLRDEDFEIAGRRVSAN
ncbi:MAG: site-specific integrase [Pseudomonas asiatica]